MRTDGSGGLGTLVSRAPVNIKHGLRTTDYGLGIKHGLGYKTRTKALRTRYEIRTEHNGLGIKHEERFYIE